MLYILTKQDKSTFVWKPTSLLVEDMKEKKKQTVPQAF